MQPEQCFRLRNMCELLHQAWNLQVFGLYLDSRSYCLHGYSMLSIILSIFHYISPYAFLSGKLFVCYLCFYLFIAEKNEVYMLASIFKKLCQVFLDLKPVFFQYTIMSLYTLRNTLKEDKNVSRKIHQYKVTKIFGN